MKKLKIELNLISSISLILIVGYVIVFRNNVIDGMYNAIKDLTEGVK